MKTILRLTIAALCCVGIPRLPALDPGNVPPARLPDLAMETLAARVDWVRSEVGNDRFRVLLEADLAAVSADCGTRLFLDRGLPTVNYAVVGVEPLIRPLPVESDVSGANGDPGSGVSRPEPVVMPDLERIRRRLGELPYVAACVMNPVDRYWVMEFAPDPAQGPAEVVPNELVLVLRSFVIPILQVRATVRVTPPEWTGEVLVRFALHEATGEKPLAVMPRLARFVDGKADVSCTFVVKPGEYNCSAKVDPADLFIEEDETNNEATTTATVGAQLLRLGFPELIVVGVEGRPARGAVGLANLGAEPVEIDRGGVAFQLDGSEVSVNWVGVVDPATGEVDEPGPVSVPPGQAAFLPFELVGEIAAGEHVLSAGVEALGLDAAAPFLVRVFIPPKPNLRLLGEEAGAEKIVVRPEPGDPSLAQMLTDEAWSALGDQPGVKDIAVAPQPWPEPMLGGVVAMNNFAPDPDGMPMRRPDLEVTVACSEASPALEKAVAEFAETARRLWYVADAWVMADIQALAGEVDAAGQFWPGPVPAEGTMYRVGIILNREAEPKAYRRVQVPVLCQTEGDPMPLDQRPVAETTVAPAPLRPVIVEFAEVREDVPGVEQAAPGDAVLRYRTRVRVQPDQGPVPACAYLPADIPALLLRVTVDPDNLVAESDETDNSTRFKVEPVASAEFTASAWVLSAANDLTLARDSRLVVRGTLINTGDVPIQLEFPTSLQMDFALAGVYRWSKGKTFEPGPFEVEIAVGETHEWELEVPAAEILGANLLGGAAGLPTADGSILPRFVLDVELVGTDYRAQTMVQFKAPSQPVFRARASLGRELANDAKLPLLVLTVEGVLENPGDSDLALEFPSSLQMDYAWGDLYRWSANRAFLEVITEVLVPAGGSYRWEIRTPLSEIWGAVVAPATDWVAKIPRRALILDVELVGTPYRNSAVVELPGSGGILGLDENGNGLPDLWEQQFDQTQTDPGQAPTGDNADPNADPDGDGWRNLAEFLQGTDPLDPQSLPPGRVFRFQLWTGWNLISLPIILEDSTCAGVFGANIQAPVWTFRPEGGYAEVERLEPHTAYWVFAERATELAVAGQPHAAGRCRMGGGWNLVGAGGPASLPATVREQASVWQWSAAEQCYVADPDPVLQEGRGYWIAMPETMGAPVEVEILTNE